MSSTLYPGLDPEQVDAIREIRRRDELVEEEPQNRPKQPCWCTDFHLDVGLHLKYCPRHGREPDPELWEMT